MPRVVAYEDVKAGRERRKATGGHIWRTFFMRPQVAGVPRDPYAFLSEGDPKRILVTHFHRVDQFQVIVGGDGLIGKHKLAPNAVHFARANTPYGPLVNGDQGLAFLTLRTMGDPTGQHHIPEAKGELMSIPNRDPWQASEMARFEQSADVSVREFALIKDERGLAAFSLRLNSGARTFAPDPSHSDGQFVVVTKGSLKHQGKEHKALTIAFVKPDEKPLELEAGPEGLEALVLNFPRQKEGAPSVQIDSGRDKPYRIWQCQMCAFVYDEAAGMPEEGLPPGTRWEDVPADWSCPDCYSSKADFEMQIVG